MQPYSERNDTPKVYCKVRLSQIEMKYIEYIPYNGVRWAILYVLYR